MTKLENPPLIEAIFELRWGESAPGQFSYSQDEQSLFAGKVSASAASKGYGLTEYVHQNPVALPMAATHRFRSKKDVWPCFQVGLGLFTVNQTKNGYGWSSFKASVKSGLEIYNQAEPNKLNSVKNSLVLALRYQDGFFPEQGDSIEEYLAEHFKVKAGLPNSFLDTDSLDRAKSGVHLNIRVESKKPKGSVVITVANAIINGQPGLLMETIVESKVSDALQGQIDIDSILEWAGEAHDLQKHSFKTLISPSAYK